MPTTTTVRFQRHAEVRRDEQVPLAVLPHRAPHPHGGEVLGALQLINAKGPDGVTNVPFTPDMQSFVEALAASAATAIYNKQLSTTSSSCSTHHRTSSTAPSAGEALHRRHCERVPIIANSNSCSRSSSKLLVVRWRWRRWRPGPRQALHIGGERHVRHAVGPLALMSCRPPKLRRHGDEGTVRKDCERTCSSRRTSACR